MRAEGKHARERISFFGREFHDTWAARRAAAAGALKLSGNCAAFIRITTCSTPGKATAHDN